MRAIGLVSVGLMMITLPVTDAAAASNAWCAVYNRRGGTSENCGYATLNQCRAQVLGLGGWCPPWWLIRGTHASPRNRARTLARSASMRRALNRLIS